MHKNNQNNWEYERRTKPSLPKKRKPGESNPKTEEPREIEKDPTKKPKRKKKVFNESI